MLKVTYIISDIDKALAFEWIADNLNKEKYQLSFILLNPGSSYLQSYLKEKQIPVTTIKVKSKADWPSASLGLCKLLKQQKPDIVHCHLITANILGLSAAKWVGIKKRIYTRHHSDFHHRYFPKGIRWDRFCNKMATKIVAPSNAVRHVLTQMEQVPAKKISLIPHGFDLTYFDNVSIETISEKRQNYNPDNKSPVIGVIARFTELKGIQYIIPAFQKLLAQYPQALLIFFGAVGDYQKVLDGMLKELPDYSYKKVAFENNLASIYKLMDVFVQASTDTTIEAFGQTYVEALASGIPSVFTLSGIAPDFIEDEKNALVVPFKDSNAIYNAIIRILNDEALRGTLITNGKLSVQKRFALSTMISSLENLYNE